MTEHRYKVQNEADRRATVNALATSGYAVKVDTVETFYSSEEHYIVVDDGQPDILEAILEWVSDHTNADGDTVMGSLKELEAVIELAGD